MSGKLDEAMGRAKEAAGAVTDDNRLRTEGRVDQTAGKAKAGAEHLAEKVKAGAENLAEKMKEGVERVKEGTENLLHNKRP